jgi:hypothetical protein
VSKTTTAALIVAAVLVVVAAVLLGRRGKQPTGQTGAGAGGPASTVQGNIASAFSNFVNAVTNWAPQWGAEQVRKAAGLSAAKPAPINERGASVQAPAGATPNVQTAPIYA